MCKVEVVISGIYISLTKHESKLVIAGQWTQRHKQIRILAGGNKTGIFQLQLHSRDSTNFSSLYSMRCGMYVMRCGM